MAKIKREDGSCSEYKNAEFIPAFLMIPKELLIRCGRELFMLPRTRAGLFADPGTIRKVESNLFRECVIDAYAYMAWPHMGLKGRLEDYSGYNPCWNVAHAPSLWIDELTDCGVLPSLEQWLQETEPYPDRYHMFMPYALVDAYLSIAVPNVMRRDGYAEWLNCAQENPCFEDFDERQYSWQKADFQKRWYHTRTKHPTTQSVDVLRIHEIENGAEPGLFRSNEHAEFENEVAAQIDAERFLQTLSETDQKILSLRLKGRKMHPRGRVREEQDKKAVSLCLV